MSNAQKIGNTAPIEVGPIRLDGGAMLAPMSGVSDLAMRRIARRFGAALVFSEMVAAETYLEGDAEAAMRAEGEGVSPHAVQLVGREPRALAETARQGRGGGRGDHRRQHGLPGAPGFRRARRRGADARSRRRRADPRRRRRGGFRSGDGQDAARLGRDVAERARAGAAGGARGRPDGDRSWAHPGAILRRPGRLEGGARRGRSRRHAGGRQRRLRRPRGRARHAGPVRARGAS